MEQLTHPPQKKTRTTKNCFLPVFGAVTVSERKSVNHDCWNETLQVPFQSAPLVSWKPQMLPKCRVYLLTFEMTHVSWKKYVHIYVRMLFTHFCTHTQVWICLNVKTKYNNKMYINLYSTCTVPIMRTYFEKVYIRQKKQQCNHKNCINKCHVETMKFWVSWLHVSFLWVDPNIFSNEFLPRGESSHVPKCSPLSQRNCVPPWCGLRRKIGRVLVMSQLSTARFQQGFGVVPHDF